MAVPTDLDELAWKYLTGPRPHYSEEREAVIKAGAAIVFPLLRACLRYFEHYRITYFKDLVKEASKSRLGKDFVYHAFIEATASSFVEDVVETVSTIDQPAWDSMCRALWENHNGMKILAAIMLSHFQSHSTRTIKRVEEALVNIEFNDRNKEYVKNSGIRLLLALVAEPAGTPEVKQFIQSIAREHSLPVDELRKGAQYGAWYYLLNNGFLK